LSFIKNFLEPIAITGSVIGGFLVALTYPLEGHCIWLVSNSLWLIHFKQSKDIWAFRLFSLYMLQVFIGIYMWSR